MFDPNYIEPPDLPQSDPYAGNPSTTATGAGGLDWQWNNPGNTNQWGFTYGSPSSQNPSDPGGNVTVGQPTDVTGPSGGSNTDFYGTPDQPTMTDQQMIDKLGYDPGDPRNDLTKGFGSGVPTQRIIGNIANFLGNAAFPGLGALTGAAAAKITQMIQNGAGKAAVANAIKQFQSGGGGGDTPSGSPTGNAPSGGSPFGGLFSGLPEGFTESGRFGGGAPVFQGPGDFGPQWQGGSIFGGSTNLNPNPMGGQVVRSGVNAPGGWGGNYGYSGSTLPTGMRGGMANLYLHGAPMQSWAQNQGYNNVGDWLRQSGFTLAGGNPSGAGVSGAERPMTSSR